MDDTTGSVEQPVYEPYSRRMERLTRGDEPVLYEYDRFPKEFRIQVYTLIDDVIGKSSRSSPVTVSTVRPQDIWDSIHDRIAFERGKFDVYHPNGRLDRSPISKREQLRLYLVYKCDEAPHLIDAIEIAIRCIIANEGAILRYQHDYSSRRGPRNAVQELNRRFKEHKLGYAFDIDSAQIQRVDSEYLHSEVILPSLHLLRRAEFKGGETEFIKAHDHYRHGRYEEAMTDALKAFESTMKAICDRRKWAYDPDRAPAKALVDTMFANQLIPEWAQSEFASVRSLLESGLPTARNRSAGHGQGSTVRQVPDYLAAIALHMAAANIVLLVEAFNALPPKRTGTK